MSVTFKQFLVENELMRELSTDEAISWVSTNAKHTIKVLISNLHKFEGLFRGIKRGTYDHPLLQTPIMGGRKASTGHSYHNLMIDLSGQLFARRDSSVIMTSNKDVAGTFGNAYVVIPFDGAKFTMSNAQDMWDLPLFFLAGKKFPSDVYSRMVSVLRVFSRIDWDTPDTIIVQLHNIPKIEDSKDVDVIFDELSKLDGKGKLIASELKEYLKTQATWDILNDALRGKVTTPSKFYMNELRYILEDINKVGDSFKNAFNAAIRHNNTSGADFINIDNIEKLIELLNVGISTEDTYSREIWTESPCLLVPVPQYDYIKRLVITSL